MNRLTTLFFLLFLLTCSVGLRAQNTNALTIAEHMPEYPGGNDSLMQDLTAHLRYPKACVDSNIQGKVYLKFIVRSDGSISDVQPVKSPHPLLTVAAIDALSGVGKFRPGIQDGKPVSVWYSIPVQFKIKTQAVPKKGSDIIVKNVADYFPGGVQAYEMFVKTAVVIPKEADSARLDAIILARCKVNKMRKLEPFEILNDVNKIFEREVARLIYIMPPLTDSIEKYDLSRMVVVVPVAFNTYGNNIFNSSIVNADSKQPYNEGVKFFTDKNYKEALRLFDEAIKLNPHDGDAFYNRGLTKINLGQAVSCEDFLRAYAL